MSFSSLLKYLRDGHGIRYLSMRYCQTFVVACAIRYKQHVTKQISLSLYMREKNETNHVSARVCACVPSDTALRRYAALKQ